MDGKVCIITGATSGIGKVMAVELAKKGARIGIIARNKIKAGKTRERIISLTKNKKIDVHIADFSSLNDVKMMSAEINQAYDHVDLLMNNAGIILSKKRELSAEGYELTFTINHLSPFLLTASIFDKLIKSEQGRIIHTSSVAHNFAKIDFNDIHLRRNYSPFLAYSNSKLYNLMFNKELAKRMKIFPHLSSFAFHPGLVGSNFSSNSGGFLGFMYKISSPFLATNEQGAETGMYLATEPNISRYNGSYFIKKKLATPMGRYLNKKDCSRLWSLSEEMTGTRFLTEKPSTNYSDSI